MMHLGTQNPKTLELLSQPAPRTLSKAPYATKTSKALNLLAERFHARVQGLKFRVLPRQDTVDGPHIRNIP